jgi:hypothetical protein
MPPVLGRCGGGAGGGSGVAPAPAAYGVWGDCRDAAGVYGSSRINPGVFGTAIESIGVLGESDQDPAVYGQSRRDQGVFGYGLRYGVHGAAGGYGSDADPTVYAGVYAQGGDFGLYGEGLLTGLYSKSSGPGGSAAILDGPVWVNGPLFVTPGNPKSAAVPHPDGTLRQLYSLESPDSWFEDIGRAEISGGQARIELDPDFAAVVRTDEYHVFLTPEGETNGLYVSARTPSAFEVREQGTGTGTLTFSYRVVAKRKDVEVERLKTVEPPAERAAPTTEQPPGWREWDQHGQ